MSENCDHCERCRRCMEERNRVTFLEQEVERVRAVAEEALAAASRADSMWRPIG